MEMTIKTPSFREYPAAVTESRSKCLLVEKECAGLPRGLALEHAHFLAALPARHFALWRALSMPRRRAKSRPRLAGVPPLRRDAFEFAEAHPSAVVSVVGLGVEAALAGLPKDFGTITTVSITRIRRGELILAEQTFSWGR